MQQTIGTVRNQTKAAGHLVATVTEPPQFIAEIRAPQALPRPAQFVRHFGDAGEQFFHTQCIPPFNPRSSQQHRPIRLADIEMDKRVPDQTAAADFRDGSRGYWIAFFDAQFNLKIGLSGGWLRGKFDIFDLANRKSAQFDLSRLT